MYRRGMLREYSGTVSIFSRILDCFTIVAAAWVAYYFRFGYWELSEYYELPILVGGLLVLIIFPWAGIYNSWRGRGLLSQVKTLLFAWAAVAAILIILAGLTKSGEYFSRLWMSYWFAFGTLFIISTRAGYTLFLRYMRRKGFNSRNIVIVGSGDLTNLVAERIKFSTWTGLEISAFFSDQEGAQSPISGIPVHPLSGIVEYVQRNGIDEVWLALPISDEKSMQSVLFDLRHCTTTIRYVPDILGFRLLNHAVTEIAGLPVLDLSVTPMLGINRAIKELEDRVLAFLIILLISPVMLAVAFGVKVTSRGPILFKQYRHGWDGKPIKIYKFRSMVVHQEKTGAVTQATKGDARITPFGAFIRKTSLDELPQFFNVLQGRMSIVGPRPHAMEHNEEYKDLVDDYMQRHKVKPGITGWAQVNGWRGETDNIGKMQRRVEFDLYYIENWSLWLDIKIITLTLFRGFVHKNAY